MDKKGLDLSPEEAHRLWTVAVAGKENKATDFGIFVYILGLGNTLISVKKNGITEINTDKENKARREQVAKFLRSWADNLEGK